SEFTLYYGIGGADYRNEGTHRNYCRFVGRLNAVLRDAKPVRPILIYYPIEELQSEFRPYNGSLTDLSKQSERAQQIVHSFNTIGAGLSRVQTSFCLIDRDTLKNLTNDPSDSEEANRLKGMFTGVIFPRWSEKIDYGWTDPNFREYWVEEDKPLDAWEDVARELGAFSGPRLTPEPSAPNLIEGTFEREGRLVFLLSNADSVDWSGTLRMTGVGADVSFASEPWTVLDPQSGSICSFEADDFSFPVKLAGRQTLFFVSPEMKR
ncbi:MAG: hypothetical protein J6X44_06810, partial [Thermoguttaceae bacterium]|nr:hypothetical protein [Thermoguttaceae bacterium]